MTCTEMRSGFQLVLPGGYRLEVRDADDALDGDPMARAANAVAQRQHRTQVVARIRSERAKRPPSIRRTLPPLR